MKCVAGDGKVWGTRKKESCDKIAKEIVGAVLKVACRFSVVKRVDQVNVKGQVVVYC